MPGPRLQVVPLEVRPEPRALDHLHDQIAGMRVSARRRERTCWPQYGGYATSAAVADVPGYRIKQHTRHKSDPMVSRYIREADKWTKSGLKAVGL